MTTAESWDYLYRFLGIKDFMDYISSSALQSSLLPVKLVFIFFSILFSVFVIYFYINSSYIRYQFLLDVVEFTSWQPSGLRQINKRWKKIVKKIEEGNKTENEYKLAIVEADYFLQKVLEDSQYKGETFEELMSSVNKKILPNSEDILSAHIIRDSIVHDSDYQLDLEKAKKILSDYENAIKSISGS